MKNIIILFLVFGILFFIYRSCTSGYEKYGYFVHVKNEAIYEKTLSDSDPDIISHGRKLVDNILAMDQRIDNSDGPNKGLFRWYICSGIDCDEGWQKSFTVRSDNMKETGNKKMSIDAFEKRKIEEYSRYDPSKVNKDVDQDILQKTIKLFYKDFSEVPELLCIDESADNLPSHKMISIGAGCIDPYNSEDCSNAYRSAIDRALTYGRAYNRAIARCLNLNLKEDTLKRLNATQRFIGGEQSGRHRLKIELSDVQPLFGGRNIWLDCSTGYLYVQTVRRAQKGLEQRNYAFTLEKDDIDRIVNVFIANDFLSLRDTEKKGVPDQATPKIVLENSVGKVHSVWNWAPPIRGGKDAADDHFHAVYRTILRLETKAQETLEPINTGPYKG